MTALKNIMVVENEEFIRDIAAMCLKDLAHFDITMCESGQEALDKFAEAKPQLVLLDVMMPHMNGMEVLRKMRALPGGNAIPIIFMTARAHPVQVKEYTDAGADGVISKPFDPLSIAKELTDIWENYQKKKSA